MKSLILSLSVLLSLFAFSRSVVADATQGPGAAVKPSLMPPERAKATFEDQRVKTFMSVVSKDFGGKCSVPEFTKTEAKLTQVGAGDFSSSFYELTIPCPGNNGLAAVQLTVEFSPPLGTPLNLVLSLQYRR